MATPKPSSSLSLTRSELTFCKKMAETEGLNSQRAKAILAINDGATQANAAEASGLTLGQVRYITSRFRLHSKQALEVEPASPAKISAPSEIEVKVKAKTKNKKAKLKSKDKDKKAKKDKSKDKDKKKNKSEKKAKKDKKKKAKK